MIIMEMRVRDLVDEMIPGPHTTVISCNPPADWPFGNPYSSWLTVNVGDDRFVAGFTEDGVDESVYDLPARIRSSPQIGSRTVASAGGEAVIPSSLTTRSDASQSARS